MLLKLNLQRFVSGPGSFSIVTSEGTQVCYIGSDGNSALSFSGKVLTITAIGDFSMHVDTVNSNYVESYTTNYAKTLTITMKQEIASLSATTATGLESITITFAATPSGTNKLKFGTETPSKLYMGETEVTKVYMGDTLVYEKSESSGETWLLNKFNGNLTASAIDVNTQFTSNNTNYTRFRCVKSDPFTTGIYYDDVQIWNSSDDYTNQAYRTVTFATPPTGNLLTWLQANGVKQ